MELKGQDHHFKGSNGDWKNHSVRIMVLFNGCGNRPGHPDPVGPHDDHFFFTLLVEIDGIQGLAVLGSQFEDVADLNPALELQFSFAPGAGIPGMTRRRSAN